MKEQIKCCAYCIRLYSSASITSASSTSATSVPSLNLLYYYYCTAFKKCVDPNGCCPWYVPAEGYEPGGEVNDYSV